MKLLSTPHEKKSFTITSCLFVIFLLIIFLYQFKAAESSPLLQGGDIAIRFGQHEKGMGPLKPSEVVETSPAVEETKQATSPDKKIVTQQIKETTSIKSSEKPADTKTKANDIKKTKNSQPSQSTTDALNSILKGDRTNGAKTSGSGNDNVAGNKGSLSGDMYSNSYYGSGRGQGTGGGNSWGLNGRTLAGHNAYKQNCNESGTVVIQVTVNQQGTVTSAKLSLKGTTNSAPCLVEPAIRTAKSFKWKADSQAPQTQTGFVVVNFRVGG